MEERRAVERVRSKRRKRPGAEGQHPCQYPSEVKLKAVKLYLGEGYSPGLDFGAPTTGARERRYLTRAGETESLYALDSGVSK